MNMLVTNNWSLHNILKKEKKKRDSLKTNEVKSH